MACGPQIRVAKLRRTTLESARMKRTLPGCGRLRSIAFCTFSRASSMVLSEISKLSSEPGAGLRVAASSLWVWTSTAAKDQWASGRFCISVKIKVAWPQDTTTSRLCIAGPLRQRPVHSSRSYALSAVMWACSASFPQDRLIRVSRQWPVPFCADVRSPLGCFCDAPEFEFLDLAGGCFGQLLEDDTLWCFEPGQTGTHKGDHLSLCGRFSLKQLNKGTGHFAPFVIGLGHNGA